MKAAVLSLLLVLLFMLSACVEDITADDTSAFQYLQRGDSALSDDKRIQVISSQSSYDDIYYQLLDQTGTPHTIDFSRYQVLLVMAGSARPAVALEVERFSGLSDQVQILLRTEYRGAGCAATVVLQQPWALVLFPRVDKPLVITEQARVRQCAV